MPDIDKGIPLKIAGSVGAHPGSDGFHTTIISCLFQVFSVVTQSVKLGGCQFHIISPVIFLDKVCHNAGHRLTDAGMLSAILIDFNGFRIQAVGKGGKLFTQQFSP